MTKVLDSLNAALHEALADERVYLIGEDVLDPYGGAFKVTQGLSSAYPARVLPAPISEAGMVGVAAGMALRGLRPVVEIMFGDFTTLIADQVINHLAKFRWMYNEQVRAPVVIRTPMGGRRGYGPTHSQTLEKLFLGVPGLRVLAPTAMGDPGALLRSAILDDDGPVLFVENKLLYLSSLWPEDGSGELERTEGADPQAPAPSFTVRLRQAGPPQLTIAAYGHMAELARPAVERLAYEFEIVSELVVPTQLAPVDLTSILDSVGRTGRLLVAEEASLSWGWGAEIVARVAELARPPLRSIRRVAAREHPVPACGPLEDMALPGTDDIVKSAQEML